ncbi:SDR family NAD(P)-dependent oxidoreductase [Isosphaeraceae bacterium EP7]
MNDQPPRFALVTGASSGLGRELARQLVLERGYVVLATARRRDRLDELAAGLPAGRVRVLDGDLALPGFRGQLWEWADAESGGLDLLVNNAGLGHYAPLADEDPAMIGQIIEVNLVAVVDLTRRAVGHMLGRGRGQVVQVSSVLGSIGMPYSATYVATKHAVDGLVKSLRYELVGTNVRVWAAQPGRTESEFHSTALGQGSSNQGRTPHAAAAGRVARAILRGLDRDVAILAPTWAAWGTLAAARLFPRTFDRAMSRWAAGYFGREIDRAR